MIWLLGGLVAAAAIAGLAAPWWWSAFARRAGLQRRTANVTAYKGRLRELEADVAAGVLAAEAAEGARQELAARLMADVEAAPDPTLATRPSRGLLLGVAAALLVFAGAWYAVAGGWRTQALIELARTSPELARAQAVDDMIARLREKVRATPTDADSWAWLGRSYRDRGNYVDAAQAFGRASEIKGGQDPDLLLEEGEALAFAQNRDMSGAPAQRFAQALALAPDHPQALWYSGIAALQAGDAGGASAHWERLLRQPLPDDTRATLEHSLAQLRKREGLEEAPVAAPEAPAAKAAAGPVKLEIRVSVAPALAGEVRPEDTLFVYATDGASRMPLAIRRLSAGALPLETTLDDSNSMMAARKLSSVERWRVIARISRSGSAAGQPGDLEGSVELSRADAGKPVQIVIGTRRP